MTDAKMKEISLIAQVAATLIAGDNNLPENERRYVCRVADKMSDVGDVEFSLATADAVGLIEMANRVSPLDFSN